MESLWYRNPQTGFIQPMDEFARPEGNKFQGYYRNRDGFGGCRIELREFATDSALALLRIADPVQTDLVQGYSLPETIGDNLMTPKKMAKESGRFPAFGKESFFIPGDLKRAVGAPVSRLATQNGYVLMGLSEFAEGVGIENRERNEWAGSPDLLITSKLNTVVARIARYRELSQAILLTTYANYATGNYATGASLKWATTGDPIHDIRQLVLQVRKTAGQSPKDGWCTPTTWELIINNATVKQTLKGLVNFGSLEAEMITPKMFAAACQLNNWYVGYATYSTDSASIITDGAVNGGAVTDGYIWEAVNSSCAGVIIKGTGGGIEPAFGYTWERQNSPIVESYYENRTKSQIWDYEHFFTAAITLNTAGAMYYSIA